MIGFSLALAACMLAAPGAFAGSGTSVAPGVPPEAPPSAGAPEPEQTAPGVPPAVPGAEVAPGPTEAELHKITPYVNRGLLYGPGQGGVVMIVRGSTSAINRGYFDERFGIAGGITPNLTIEAYMGTLTLGRQSFYHSPSFGAWYGLVDTPHFELDATTAFTFDLGDAGGTVVRPGAQAVIRLADEVRFDVGAFVPVPLSGTGNAGLETPVSMAVQLTRGVHVAVGSGLVLSRPSEGVTQVGVPLGVSLGCTVSTGNRGYFMLIPSVSWPNFFTFDGSQGTPGGTVFGMTFALVTPP